MVLLFELPLCREALGKISFLAMFPLGRPAGAGGSIPVSAGGGTGRGRACGGLGVARDRFGSASGVEVAGGEACGGGSRGQPRYAGLQ
jgi:hypothetical protein